MKQAPAIRALRGHLGLTQEQFASAIGVSRNYLATVEVGDTDKELGRETLGRVWAKWGNELIKLGIDAPDLLGWEWGSPRSSSRAALRSASMKQAQAIRALRGHLGLTQEQFASAIGVSRNYLATVEVGDTDKELGRETLGRVWAKWGNELIKLGIDAPDLLGWEAPARARAAS